MNKILRFSPLIVVIALILLAVLLQFFGKYIRTTIYHSTPNVALTVNTGGSSVAGNMVNLAHAQVVVKDGTESKYNGQKYIDVFREQYFTLTSPTPEASPSVSPSPTDSGSFSKFIPAPPYFHIDTRIVNIDPDGTTLDLPPGYYEVYYADPPQDAADGRLTGEYSDSDTPLNMRFRETVDGDQSSLGFVPGPDVKDIQYGNKTWHKAGSFTKREVEEPGQVTFGLRAASASGSEPTNATIALMPSFANRDTVSKPPLPGGLVADTASLGGSSYRCEVITSDTSYNGNHCRLQPLSGAYYGRISWNFNVPQAGSYYLFATCTNGLCPFRGNTSQLDALRLVANDRSGSPKAFYLYPLSQPQDPQNPHVILQDSVIWKQAGEVDLGAGPAKLEYQTLAAGDDFDAWMLLPVSAITAWPVMANTQPTVAELQNRFNHGIAADDEDDSFELQGLPARWRKLLGEGFNGTRNIYSAGNEGQPADEWRIKGYDKIMAKWLLSGMTPYRGYDLYATWTPRTGGSDNAVFAGRIIYGNQALDISASINQSQAPSGPDWRGRTWQKMSAIRQPVIDPVFISLEPASGNNQIEADALMLVPRSVPEPLP